MRDGKPFGFEVTVEMFSIGGRCSIREQGGVFVRHSSGEPRQTSKEFRTVKRS